MISHIELTEILHQAFPDAEVAVQDTTGSFDHYRIVVSSSHFEDKTLIERHQMVYQALDKVLKDGRLHAVEIKTDVP